MASKSIDWDELLLTNDPKKKEIEVSFKKIDGEGNTLSFGDAPGTPPVTADPNGEPSAPVDDEGDYDIPEDSPPAGGPIEPEEPLPECIPHDCDAYVDYLNGGESNILRLNAFSNSTAYDIDTQAAVDQAFGWNIPTEGPDAGRTGFFGIGGTVISNNGSVLRTLAHLNYEDGRTDYSTHISSTTGGENLVALPYGPVIDDNDVTGGCAAGHIYGRQFGTVQTNYNASPSGRIDWYENRDEQEYWAAYGVNPTNPVVTNLFDPVFPYNEILLIEPWEHAEYLTHAIVEGSSGSFNGYSGLGKVPTEGKLKFLAGNGGLWSTYVVAGQNVGNRESRWFGEVYCTFDYANETMTLETSQIDPDSIYNPVQTVIKTLSVPRERMTNCWVKVRMSTIIRLRTAPEFYISDAHFIEHDTRVEVSIGDYATMEATAKGRSNWYCSDPTAESNPGNFSKFWHPDGTGAGDNTSFCGISFRGLSFGEKSEKWNGFDVEPVTLACTLGPAASDSERTAWARKWKAFQTRDYCERIPS